MARPQAAVTGHLGLPTMHVNGQPNAGMTYMTYRPQERYFHDFGQVGVNFVSFLTSPHFKRNRKDLVWTDWDTFDFSEMDEIITFILRANPQALIFPRVYLFTTPWWNEQNPGELMVYHDGATMKPARGFREPVELPSWASDKWRQDTAYALRRMIRHIRSQPYGDRVVGYHLASGGTDEWYYWPYWRWFFHMPQDDFVDYSVPQTAAFRRWLKAKYGSSGALGAAWRQDAVSLDSAPIAAKEDKLKTTFFGLYDPAVSQHVIDTLDFEAELIADTIAYFCHVVKDETSGEAFTGAFYGYITGADDKGYCATHSLLHCPDLDFLTSPSAYDFREPGCGYSTYRTTTRSVQLHGKLWWDENDYYTYLTPEWKWVEGWTGPRDYPTTETQQLRQLSCQIAHASAGWWFDMEGGWFDSPEAMQMISRLNDIAERSIQVDRSSVAEVAVVVDEKSLLYLGSGGDLYRPLIMDQRMLCGRMGAPVDWILMDDLDEAPPYRMYIFLDAFRVTDEQRAAIGRLASRGAQALVWVYAPGLLGETVDVDRCAQVTGLTLGLLRDKGPLQVEVGDAATKLLPGLAGGLRYGTENKIGPVLYGADPKAEVLGELYGYGQPGLIYKKVDGVDVYYSAAPRLPEQLLRGMAMRAGVHVYDSQDDGLYINRSLIGLHTARAGRRTLYLAAPTTLYDVYRDEVIARDARQVELELPARYSALYFRGTREVWQALSEGQGASALSCQDQANDYSAR